MVRNEGESPGDRSLDVTLVIANCISDTDN